jgi:hypothetical protein
MIWLRSTGSTSSHNYLIVYSFRYRFWMTGKMTKKFYSICILQVIL